MTEIKSICVYCGSQSGNTPIFADKAQEFGEILAKNQIRLVYGGGTTGIMGTLARSSRDHGGEVLGIIPDFLLEREANDQPQAICSEVMITDSMHQRKQLMFENADAFVTLPGGIGTLEEIVEMMTWAQLGRHEKPMCFLDVDGFWKPLFELLDHMDEAGFIHSSQHLKPLIANDAADILPLLRQSA